MTATPYRYVPGLTGLIRLARRPWEYVVFRGRSVYCPVCGSTWRRWAGRTPSHGVCPRCWSLARHRFLKLAMDSDAAESPPGSSSDSTATQEKGPASSLEPREVLIFAPDAATEGWLRRAPHWNVTTTDLAAPGVDYHWDITALPIDDQQYDAIVCGHVLEHIPDDASAMRELHRVLKPGGVAYIQVPYSRTSPTDEDPSVTDPQERIRRFGQFDHVRRYGVDLSDRLTRAGFDVRTLQCGAFLPASAMRIFGLWNDTLFACRRPK